jgi:hypothetical protein
LTDILFDLETKIRQFFSAFDTKKLGLQETTITQEQTPTPEPEKIVPPKEPTPTPQPPQKRYVEGSPQQRTNGTMKNFGV